MGSAHSIKLYKPLHFNRTTSKNMSNLISSISQNLSEIDVYPKKTYPVILFFVSINDKTSYDDICLDLSAYDQVVALVKIDPGTEINPISDSIIFDIIKQIKHDTFVNNFVQLIVSKVNVIGVGTTCSVLHTIIESTNFNENVNAIYLNPSDTRTKQRISRSAKSESSILELNELNLISKSNSSTFKLENITKRNDTITKLNKSIMKKLDLSKF